MPSKSKSEPKQPSAYRFSMRTLLATTVGVALLLAAGGWIWQTIYADYYRESAALNELRRDFLVDEFHDLGRGKHYMLHDPITGIMLWSGPEFSERHLSLLAEFRYLRSIDIPQASNEIDWSGLANLRSLKSLLLDDLPDSAVLESLPTDHPLEALQLKFQPDAEVSLVSLRRVPQLTSLSIFGGKLDASELQYINELHELERLLLNDVDITDEDIAQLSDLKNLTLLIIGGKESEDRAFLRDPLPTEINEQTMTEFALTLTDATGVLLEVDVANLDPNRKINLLASDIPIHDLLHQAGLDIISVEGRNLLTTRDGAVERYPNTARLIKNNPRLSDALVSFDP